MRQAPEILDKSILLSLTKLAYSSASPSRVARGRLGVLRISSDRGDRRIFLGFEIFEFGDFLGWKILASIFFGCLI